MLACYNEAEHLQPSFEEIRETLDQTSWPYEIIFVDDVEPRPHAARSSTRSWRRTRSST